MVSASSCAAFAAAPMIGAHRHSGLVMKAKSDAKPNPFLPDGRYNPAFKEWEFKQAQAKRMNAAKARASKTDERFRQGEFTLTGVQMKRERGQNPIHYFKSRVAPRFQGKALQEDLQPVDVGIRSITAF